MIEHDEETGSSVGARRVAALLLAAGSSTRMGRNKMLLQLDGESLLRRAARKLIDAGLDPVIVVTGHAAEEAKGELEGLPCRAVFNPDHATGIHTSVRAGIDALPKDTDAVAIVLADMPHVSAEMLRGLADRYSEGGAPLVISRYGGEVNAPPMLYDRALFGELRVMERRCGREVVQRHREEAVVMDWPREALADIDTPEEYEAVRGGDA